MLFQMLIREGQRQQTETLCIPALLRTDLWNMGVSENRTFDERVGVQFHRGSFTLGGVPNQVDEFGVALAF